MIVIVSNIYFTAETRNGDPIASILNERKLTFRIQCLNTVMTYPDPLNEKDLFADRKQLRGYTIILNNIRPSQVNQNAAITFGLIKEGDRSEYMIAWKIPLANVLFGPPFQTVNCCGTTERNAKYKIHFRNNSQRFEDYYVFIRSIRVSRLPADCYTFL